jgi:hypothetical protein
MYKPLLLLDLFPFPNVYLVLYYVAKIKSMAQLLAGDFVVQHQSLRGQNFCGTMVIGA